MGLFFFRFCVAQPLLEESQVQKIGAGMGVPERLSCRRDVGDPR